MLYPDEVGYTAPKAKTTSQYTQTVADLQKTLNAEGYRDPNGRPLAVDGVMGPLTQYAQNKKAQSLAASVAGTTTGPINYTIGPGNTIVGSRGGVFQGFTQFSPTSGGAASSVRNTPSSVSGLNPEIGNLMGILRTKSNTPLPSVESTPQYTAAKARLQQEGQEASTRAVQQMAARGVLRSSMTEDAMKKIEAEIVDRLTTQVTPAIQQQLLAERESELGGIRSDLAMALQMAGMDASQAMDTARFTESGRQFDIGAMIDRARLEQQIGSQNLDNLYRLAGLTGTIPEGLPGAGGLTAEERYRQQQLANELARLNRPNEVNYAQDIRNNLLRDLNSGAITEDSLAPWQRELLGWSGPSSTQQTRDERASAYDAINDALSKSVPVDQIRQNINAQRSELIRKGVNPDELLRYLEDLDFQFMTK